MQRAIEASLTGNGAVAPHSNVLIGSNSTALEAAKAAAKKSLQCNAVILTSTLTGESREVGDWIVRFVVDLIAAVKAR